MGDLHCFMIHSITASCQLFAGRCPRTAMLHPSSPAVIHLTEVARVPSFRNQLLHLPSPCLKNRTQIGLKRAACHDSGSLPGPRHSVGRHIPCHAASVVLGVVPSRTQLSHQQCAAHSWPNGTSCSRGCPTDSVTIGTVDRG